MRRLFYAWEQRKWSIKDRQNVSSQTVATKCKYLLIVDGGSNLLTSYQDIIPFLLLNLVVFFCPGPGKLTKCGRFGENVVFFLTLKYSEPSNMKLLSASLGPRKSTVLEISGGNQRMVFIERHQKPVLVKSFTNWPETSR